MKKLLFDDMLSVNVQDEQTHETALQIAASANQTAILQWLLEHGADINSNSGGKSTPLMHSVRRGYHNIVQVLMQHKGAAVVSRVGLCKSCVT